MRAAAGSAGCPAALLAADSLLELRAGAEARDARCLDLDGLARLRVPALAGGAISHVELAEPRDVDLGTARELLLDGPERGVHGALRLAATELRLLGNLLDQLGLVHENSSWVEVAERS